MFSCVSNLGIFLDKSIKKVAGRGDLAEADGLLVLFWQSLTELSERTEDNLSWRGGEFIYCDLPCLF